MLLMNEIIYNMRLSKSILCQELSSKEMTNLMKEKLYCQGLFLFHMLELYI